MEDQKTEFIRLWKLTGWRQNELARRLRITPGGVNGIVSGVKQPSHHLLAHLRMILAQERPDLFNAPPATNGYPAHEAQPMALRESEDLREASQALAAIHSADPEGFAALAGVIQSYHGRVALPSRPRRSVREVDPPLSPAAQAALDEMDRRDGLSASAARPAAPRPVPAAPPGGAHTAAPPRGIHPRRAARNNPPSPHPTPEP